MSTTRFPIWTRSSRREVRASRRHYAGGGSCLRDLWRAWRMRDYRSARCSEKWWGARAVWGPGKRVDGVFPGRSQSFRHQRRPVDDCSPGRRGMAQNGRTRGGTFHGEMDRCRETQGWTTACSGMPDRDGKNQEDDIIAQSKRDRAGSLALVNQPQVARTCILRAFGLQMPWRFFSGVTFVLFCFVFRLYAFVEAAAIPSIVLRYAGVPIATRVFFCFFNYYLEISLFPSIFSAFSLYV